MSDFNWTPYWSAILIGLGTVFWMWWIIWDNANRQVEAEKKAEKEKNETKTQ